jgi:hypothetical protein
VAVWVGYPNKLVPMLSEYHGKAVAGGTFPAEIFKHFLEKAFPYLTKTQSDGNWEPASFPSPSYPYSSPKVVTFRGGKWQLDNGNCRSTESIDYFTGFGPAKTAPCKPNEVDVVNVLGAKRDDAIARLLQQPLKARVVYRVAPGRKPGCVIAQRPLAGTLSSWQTVTLVVAKAAKHPPRTAAAAVG